MRAAAPDRSRAPPPAGCLPHRRARSAPTASCQSSTHATDAGARSAIVSRGSSVDDQLDSLASGAKATRALPPSTAMPSVATASPSSSGTSSTAACPGAESRTTRVSTDHATPSERRRSTEAKNGGGTGRSDDSGAAPWSRRERARAHLRRRRPRRFLPPASPARRSRPRARAAGRESRSARRRSPRGLRPAPRARRVRARPRRFRRPRGAARRWRARRRGSARAAKLPGVVRRNGKRDRRRDGPVRFEPQPQAFVAQLDGETRDRRAIRSARGCSGDAFAQFLQQLGRRELRARHRHAGSEQREQQRRRNRESRERRRRRHAARRDATP